MVSAFFPDTTVLVNFAVIERWDLLNDLFGGIGTWVASVEDECRSFVSTYPGIHKGAAAVLGEAVRPTSAEHIDISIVRNLMADPFDDHPRKHLGEAESIVVARNRFQGAYFITDDRAAHRVAKTEGVRCVGTGDLLSLSEKSKKITANEHARYLEVLRMNERFPQSFTGE